MGQGWLPADVVEVVDDLDDVWGAPLPEDPVFHGDVQAEWDAWWAHVQAGLDAEHAARVAAVRSALDAAPGASTGASVLAALTVPDLAGTPDALVAAAAAARRLEAWAVWQQLQAIAGLLRAWSVTDVPVTAARGACRVWRPGQDVDPDVMVREAVVAEVALAFGIGEQTAADRVTAAEHLIIDGRSPETARLLAEGRIDWLKAWTIVSRTRHLNPTAPVADDDQAAVEQPQPTVDLARLVDAQVAPSAPELTVPALRAALDLTIARVDADAAAHAAARARKSRRVGITAGWEGPGTAQLWAIGPADAITAAHEGLDTAARHLRSNGDQRTLDQLRHDLLVTACTTGNLPAALTVPPAGSPPVVPDLLPATGTGPADAKTGETHSVPAPDTDTAAAPDTASAATPDTGTAAAPDTASAAEPDTGTAAAPDTASATEPDTVRADEPGTGIITAPGTVVEPGMRTVTEPGRGSPSGISPASGRGHATEDPTGDDSFEEECFTPPWFATAFPDVGVNITVTIALETLLGLNDDPGLLGDHGPVPADLARDLAATGIWRCIAVDDTHGTVLGVASTTFTPSYTPGAKLKKFLQYAAPRCSMLGCRTRAVRCDTDHRVPYDQGGATCSCNTHPLCRRHHRLKTAGLLTATPSTNPHHPPGTVHWTTRTGRSYPARPHAPLPGAPRPPGATSDRTRTSPPTGPPDVPPF